MPVLSLLDRVLPVHAAPIRREPARYGLVTACDGGLLEVSGLAVPVGSLCAVAHDSGPDAKGSTQAEVIGFRHGRMLMMLLGDAALLRPGARVRAEGRPGMVPVGDAFLGRAVDGGGLAIDGLGPVRAAAVWPVQGRRAGALERSAVTRPFATGVRAIDALTTMGVGQRIGVMAGSGVGKSVLIDMIARGALQDSSGADVIVVGLIGERAREVSDFVARHMAGGARQRTALVAVPADHAPNLRLRGACFATALAEHFRAQGRRVLLILDSLTRVAHAAREIGLLLGEPGAARGYPPSALAAITRLVERAGNSARSGGAVTGLYTVLADGDDPNDPVVDTARAILDGHIVLSRAIAHRGTYPAIDVPASLSRIMDDVVESGHRAAARRFRAMAAAYEANRDLVLMGAYRAGADPDLDRAVAMHGDLARFVAQDRDESAEFAASVRMLERLMGAPA